MSPKLSHVSRMELCKTISVPHEASGWLRKSYGFRWMPWYADIFGWSAKARSIFNVISACGMSSCQKLMGKDGCVSARIAMK